MKNPSNRKAVPKTTESAGWVHELAQYVSHDSHSVLYFDDGKKKYNTKQEPLTDALIDTHLSGGQEIGVHLLDKSGKAHCLVLDFDDHGGENQRLVDGTVRYYALRLDHEGINHIVERSRSGTGYHIWLVFEKAKRYDVLRKMALQLLATIPFGDSHLVEGAGGVAKGQIEIFPKGSSVGSSNIALPGAGASARLELKNGELIESDRGDIPLVKDRSPGPRTQKSKADREAAFETLADHLDASDYDQWTRMGHLLIATFGKDDDWAKSSWIEWSQTAPNADPLPKLEEKWDRHFAANPRMSEASFWFAAKNAGYAGPLPFTQRDRDRLAVLERIADVPTIRSREGETFAEIAPRLYVEVTSKAFESHLRRVAWEDSTMLSGEIVQQIQATLDALPANRADMHLRFAKTDLCYFHLGDEEATVIEIDANGWRVAEEPPVRFRQGDGNLPLPMPMEGTHEELRSFFNVDDENLPFLLAFIVSCFLRPGRAMPIAVLTGPAGSAKSTLLEFIVSLIDPKIGVKAGLPKKEDDLVVAAHNGAIVSYDNASTLARLSDELCRLATGGGLRKRTLYTDNEVTAIDVIRPIIISGIDPTVYAQDLIERLLVIELTPPDRYIDDEDLGHKFEEARPRLLGFLLNLVSRVMPLLDNIEVGEVRMAGFARIGEAVSRVLGWQAGWFAAQYKAMIEVQADEAADSDCALSASSLPTHPPPAL
jgi:hypothetical protein